MLFNPAYSKKDDLNCLHRFMRSYNFATLITNQKGEVQVAHLPLLLDPTRGTKGTLRGHMALANPLWREFENAREVLCVFNGPNGYISPSWYKDAMNVPTWNYAVVHAKGKATLVREGEAIESILGAQVDFHESQFKKPWKYDLPAEFRSDLVKAIIGFEIEITSLQGKFKLSGNRTQEDLEGAIQGITENYGNSNPQLVKIMREEHS